MKDFFKKFHRPIALKTSQTENTLFGCADDNSLHFRLKSSIAPAVDSPTIASCLEYALFSLASSEPR